MVSDDRPSVISDDPATNPFAAPTMVAPAVELEQPERDARWIRSAWPLAVAVHLPIPLIFGWSCSDDGLPKLGMFLGIAIVYFIGERLRRRRTWLMKRLTIGAFVTSISQFWPVAQMVIGLFAIGISRAIFSDQIFAIPGPTGASRELGNLPAVMSATVLTGLGLIVPSFIVGVVVVYLFGSRGSSVER